MSEIEKVRFSIAVRSLGEWVFPAGEWGNDKEVRRPSYPAGEFVCSKWFDTKEECFDFWNRFIVPETSFEERETRTYNYRYQLTEEHAFMPDIYDMRYSNRVLEYLMEDESQSCQG